MKGKSAPTKDRPTSLSHVCALALAAIFSVVTIGCSEFLGATADRPSPKEAPGPRKPVDSILDPQSGELTTEKAVLAMGWTVLAPLAENLESASNLMVKELEETCPTKDATLPANWDSLKFAWRNLAEKTHKVLALPVGPLTEKAGLLRDQLNSWPSLNLCGLDHEVVNQSQGLAPNQQLLYTSKGLAALEYLIFEATLQTQCNPNNRNNQSTVIWSQKAPEKKRLDRCRTALWLAKEFQASARTLARSWDPKSGDYASSMIDGSRGSIKDSLTALSDALFGIEFTKDTQLGKPLGFHKDCLASDKKCAALAEHPFSGAAIMAVIHRLEAFRALFTGSLSTGENSLRGFDDLLVQAGHQSVAAAVVGAVDQAISSGRSLQAQRLQDLISDMNAATCHASNSTNRAVPVCAWYSEVRSISVRLKTDVLSVLSIREPPTHAGDND